MTFRRSTPSWRSCPERGCWKAAVVVVMLFCTSTWDPTLKNGHVVSAAWVGNPLQHKIKSRWNLNYHQTRFDQASIKPYATLSSRRRKTVLHASASEGSLESLLHHHGYSRRILELTSKSLPVLAEMYDHGQWELCLVTGFQPPKNAWTAPLVEVQMASDNEDMRVVDFGQLTTVWETPPSQSMDSWRKQVENDMDKFPVQHSDLAMQRLYQSRGGPSRKAPSSSLTKKKITKLVESIPDGERRSHVDTVLRKVVKAGPGMSRLADSPLAMDYLYADYPKDTKDMLRRRLVGAQVLSRDAELGGRFKRMPCAFVAAQTLGDTDRVDRVTLINGGWLAVDQSVRAGTEARKFASRADKTKKCDGVVAEQTHIMTAADERIAQRLECLAMGELFSWGIAEDNNGHEEEQKLELDLREVLKAMGLPTTPEGAQKALLRVGRWSQMPDKVRLDPWSQPTLDAARWFSEKEKDRRRTLFSNSASALGAQVDAASVENRLDLTSLPCVCMDAKSTTFRDDAVGVRQRSITGRKVVPEASKFEILVHIADVSDIYIPDKQNTDESQFIRLLREAAEIRGMSRYDLPLGPLHLMPPLGLEALSLKTTNIDMTSKEPKGTTLLNGANPCVTLWTYIDERTGKVIDAGLERTLVSPPLAFSFADASKLLDGNVADQSVLNRPGHVLRKAKAVLSVVERNLVLWSAQHRQSNEAAQKREARLSAKELVAKQMKMESKARDDGSGGFQRTRGHRLVDAALDLYGYGVSSLLRRANAPIPRASGSGASRGGRVATAPLRRYIDGVAQRQAVSVLCGHGGPALTREECKAANKIADKANVALSNIRAVNKGSGTPKTNRDRQKRALRLLQAELAGRSRPIPAISTGRENEVTLMGVGAVAKCQDVRGSLKPGDKVLVKVRHLDTQKGILSVSFVQDVSIS